MQNSEFVFKNLFAVSSTFEIFVSLFHENELLEAQSSSGWTVKSDGKTANITQKVTDELLSHILNTCNSGIFGGEKYGIT